MKIDDNYILNNCLKITGSLNPNSLTPEIKQYLNNRYNDIPDNLFSYAEVIQRIKNNIDIRPTCKICGKPVKYLNRHEQLYAIYCSNQCLGKFNKSNLKKIWDNRTEKEKQDIKDKTKQTCLEKYGVEFSFQSENNKEKSKQTLLEKYGDEHYGQFGSKSFKEKMIKKYGYEFPQQNKKVRNKISKSLSSEQAQSKMRQTCLERYGVKYVSQNQNIQQKINESYREHNTFNSSKDEEVLFDLLSEIFNKSDIERQYFNKEQYPFNCDFFIKSLNLYIEYQGSFYHNKKLFNKDRDLNEYQKFLNKCSTNDNKNSYDNLIETWTIRDIKKWNTAKTNNLNMLLIYPYFHKDWLYYKIHENNLEIKNSIVNYLKNFIINNYKNNNRKQIIIGEQL